MVALCTSFQCETLVLTYKITNSIQIRIKSVRHSRSINNPLTKIASVFKFIPATSIFPGGERDQLSRQVLTPYITQCGDRERDNVLTCMETLSSHSSLFSRLSSSICIPRLSAHCMGKDLISVRGGEVRWGGDNQCWDHDGFMTLILLMVNWSAIQPSHDPSSPHCYHHLSKYFSFISQTIMTTSTITTIYGRKNFITDSVRWHLTLPQGRVSCEFSNVWTLFVKRMMNSRYLNG